jgi:hypothetical protein
MFSSRWCAPAVAALVAAAGFVILAPSPARAGEGNQLTYLTINAPVEIPGVVLPPGTYMFKLEDPGIGSSLVQVSSRDGSKLYSTFLTIPVRRATLSREPVVRLEKAGPSGLEAVASWFYPDELVGHKFVYPKAEAEMIAAANRSAEHRAD